jgi:hypothetical protein
MDGLKACKLSKKNQFGKVKNLSNKLNSRKGVAGKIFGVVGGKADIEGFLGKLKDSRIDLGKALNEMVRRGLERKVLERATAE